MSASTLVAPAKILVVDDSAVAVGLVRLMMAREPYAFRHAVDGAQALEIAAHDRPDLILLDWMMPGLDGLETLRRLRADPARRGIPVIMLSVRGKADDVATALAAGCVAYLTKPIEAGLLLAAVRSVLVRSAASSAARMADSRPSPAAASAPAEPLLPR